MHQLSMHMMNNIHSYATIFVLPHLPGDGSSLGVPTVEELFVVIHPDLSQTDLVADDHRFAIWEAMGALSTENVSYNRTGDNLQLPPTLPHLERTQNESQNAYIFHG